MQVYASFMKMLTRALYEAFVIVAETKGVPWQRQRKWCHGNIPVPVTRLRCRCKRECDGSMSCKDGGGDSGYRMSHVSVAWQPRVVHETNGHGANTGFISCIRQHSSTAVVSGLYLRGVRFLSISSSSREVVVHGRRGSSGSRNGG